MALVPYGADESKVNELCQMGFTQAPAREALVKASNDMSQAVGYLIEEGSQAPQPGTATSL